MSIDNVTLTSGMQANLIALQNIEGQINTTQKDLSTGKKVNSALDNPVSFFAAQNLNTTANSLSTLNDAMGQAVQTIQAANNGITSINTLIQAAQGIVQSALSTSNTTTISSYASQYDSILTQINTLATDSGYNGTNLLAGNNLTVTFNSTGTSTLTINGVTGGATAAGGLGVTTASAGASTWVCSTTGLAVQANLTQAVAELNTAETSLQTDSQNLSSSLAVVNARQTFTTSMINTLTTGADNLTLADMNEEGANMLALQTQQSLGVTALSLSSQAAQSVLKLFP